MAHVQQTITIQAPARDVWATVRNFGRIDRYLAAVEQVDTEGAGPGMTRTLTLADGSQVVEQLEAIDEAKRTLRYAIVDSPLPIREYISTMAVEEGEDGVCRVTWATRFEPDGAPEANVKALLADLYASGLQGLNEVHSS